MGIPRGATGGTNGDPLINGGRKGTAARGGAEVVSGVSFAAVSFFSGSDLGTDGSALGVETEVGTSTGEAL
jgi:hypothetical protein